MLNDKEKKNIESLKKNFNIVPESANYNYMASRRYDISRIWAKRLLRVSFFINLVSILLLVGSLLLASTKPLAQIYASTPSGKVFKLKTLRN